jgi:hypothetical protein
MYYHDIGVVKRNLRRLLAVGAALSLALAVAAGSGASAAVSSDYTFFGEASLVSPGNASATAAQMTSDADPGFGGVDFNDPSGLTVADLENLATDFNVTDDSCGGGSPRFQVSVDSDGDGDHDGNLFVYLGPPPAYTACVPGWQSTGNLADDTDFVDATQLGGLFYDSWLNVRTTYGAFDVLGVSIATDGSWNAAATLGDGEQTVQVDNVEINDTLYTFELESKDQCKNGGWEDFGFRNQGQCVRFVETGKDSRV